MLPGVTMATMMLINPFSLVAAIPDPFWYGGSEGGLEEKDVFTRGGIDGSSKMNGEKDDVGEHHGPGEGSRANQRNRNGGMESQIETKSNGGETSSSNSQYSQTGGNSESSQRATSPTNSQYSSLRTGISTDESAMVTGSVYSKNSSKTYGNKSSSGGHAGSASTTHHNPHSTPTNNGPSQHSPSVGVIIGGIVGGLVFLALLAGLGILYYRRRRNRLAPSTTHRAANDHRGWLQLSDSLDDSHRVFRPDLKYNHTAQDSNRRANADVEAALQRKAEIMDDLRFEAAVRDGVKA